jgi:hypothetical protein
MKTTKTNSHPDLIIISTLFAVLPPIGILFILVNWLKGKRVDTISILGLLLGIISTVYFCLQLMNHI